MMMMMMMMGVERTRHSRRPVLKLMGACSMTFLPVRASFSVVAPHEGVKVGRVHGPITATPVLGTIQFDETFVEGESVSDTVSPSVTTFLKHLECVGHVVVYLA